MKNLNLTFVAIIFAFFALTSCEKESVQEMTSTTNITITERNLPNGPINIVNEDVETYATKATFAEQASSRSREITWIDEIGTSLNGTTINEGNTFDNRYYPSCVNEGTGETFTGDDKIYYLEIDQYYGSSYIHSFRISELTADLDLFLFALDQNGYISECKAVSITAGYQEEMINVSGLNPGAYIVVVDGYTSGIAGDFKFEKSTVVIDPVCFGNFGVVETTLGDAFATDHAEWTFVKKDSGIASVYQETFNDLKNISLKNVQEEDGKTITTEIYLGIDNGTIAIVTTIVEADGATVMSDTFGQITNIECGN